MMWGFAFALRAHYLALDLFGEIETQHPVSALQVKKITDLRDPVHLR
jgi:hypothetical protein